MGKGRPRKPLEMKIAEGTYQAHRDGPPSAYVKAEGSPAKPETLNEEAAALWDRIVPGLVASGVAKAVDGPQLELMCEWWSNARRFADAMHERKNNDRAAMALARTSAVCVATFDRIAARFGLTNADRGKLRNEATGVSGVRTRSREA